MENSEGEERKKRKSTVCRKCERRTGSLMANKGGVSDLMLYSVGNSRADLQHVCVDHSTESLNSHLQHYKAKGKNQRNLIKRLQNNQCTELSPVEKIVEHGVIYRLVEIPRNVIMNITVDQEIFNNGNFDRDVAHQVQAPNIKASQWLLSYNCQKCNQLNIFDEA